MAVLHLDSSIGALGGMALNAFAILVDPKKLLVE